MTVSRRLRELFLLAESHPHYFLHTYRRELTNAGYEEIAEPVPAPIQAVAKGHGKKVLSGPSLVKSKRDKNAEFAKAYGAEGFDQKGG